MEREYKWRASERDLSAALLWASGRIGSETRKIQMHAVYYDTATALLKQQGAALRLRQENDKHICCLKIRNQNAEGGLHQHEEYQCEARTVDSGLCQLPKNGAPKELCDEVLAEGVTPLCTVAFSRISILVMQDNTVCELCLDQGSLSRGTRQLPLCEIELEFITGNLDDFHLLASELADFLSLVPEPLSKVARAMQL